MFLYIIRNNSFCVCSIVYRKTCTGRPLVKALFAIDDMRETTYKGALLLSVYKTSSAAWSLEISPLLFVRLLLGSASFSRRTSSLHFRPGYPSISRPTRREKEEGLLLISSADVEPRRRSHPRCCCACVTSMLLAVSLPPSRGNDVVDRLISHI